MTQRVIEGRVDVRELEGRILQAVERVITSYSIHYTKLYDSTLDDEEIAFPVELRHRLRNNFV